MILQQPTAEQIASIAKKISDQIATSQKSVQIENAPTWDNQTLLIFGIGVLVFGALALLMVSNLLKSQIPGTAVLRNFHIPLIISASVFLVTVGWSKDQIAPVIGLFGTLAGYILGRTENQGTGTLPDALKPASPAADETKKPTLPAPPP